MKDWRQRARRLADELDTAGVLAPGWRDAVENTARHVLVPYFYDSDGKLVDGADPEQHDHWAEAVYRDETLDTQLAKVPGQEVSWPTSSATRPSMQLLMLGLLNVQDGDTVLDIGTGPGANVAMLCRRLGAGNITSIDIDPRLIDNARERLAELGYFPHLVAGDGAGGVRDRAPFDRIIATCAVQTIPPAWVRQLRPRGTIVTDIRSDVSSALAALIKIDENTVQGRFVATPGYFMWLRAEADNPLRDGGVLDTATDLSNAETSTTDVDPVLLDDDELRFMLTLCLPDLVSAWSMDAGRGPAQVLRWRDGSSVEIGRNANAAGQYRLIQAGPRQAWQLVADVVSQWERAGRPDRSRFGMTADAAGTQTYWLDSSDNTINVVTV